MILWGFTALIGVLLVWFFLFVFIFGLVYILEILLKGAKILTGFKIALKIAFNGKNALRVLGFLILSLLFALVLLIPYFILLGLSYLIGISPEVQSAWGFILIIVFVPLLLFPLHLIMSVYFYNDQILRYERCLK